MNTYYIRFNTKHNGSELVWRIFENDVEHLASNVSIIGKCSTVSTWENDQQKWNFCCQGTIVWDGTSATITTS